MCFIEKRGFPFYLYVFCNTIRFNEFKCVRVFDNVKGYDYGFEDVQRAAS